MAGLLSVLFKGKLFDGLRQARVADQLDLGADVASFPALVDSRLLEVTDRAVTFRTRGEDTATLSTMEFMRRFLQHVLPRGFVKIRHYGLAASANVQTKHAAAMLCLGALPELELERGDDGECGADKSEPSEPPEGLFPAAVFVALLAAGRVPCPRCTKGLLRVRGGGGGPVVAPVKPDTSFMPIEIGETPWVRAS